MDHEDGDAGSEASWDDEQTPIVNADMPADPTASPKGMLPRDMQRKTAYYDYAAEKQLSQADMKLFYQRSQLESQRTGGDNRGSQASPPGSPATRTKIFSHIDPVDQLGQHHKSGSMHSVQSGISVVQK